MCYEITAVMNRIVLSVLLAMALPIAATPISARTCILSNASSEKACKPGSCANKMCCATSRKNTAPSSQPLAKSDSSLNPRLVLLDGAQGGQSDQGSEPLQDKCLRGRFQCAPPVASFMIFSSVASSRDSSPAICPRCITRMRSESASSSSSSEEASRTAQPRPHSARMMS